MRASDTAPPEPSDDHARPRRSRPHRHCGRLQASLRYNYSTFQSAVSRGASCSELFDQRERFSDPETLAKVDDDLAEIGCTSRDATRNDR